MLLQQQDRKCCSILPYFTENFWNPSDIIYTALNNHEVVNESRGNDQQDHLEQQQENIYFTAGG